MKGENFLAKSQKLLKNIKENSKKEKNLVNVKGSNDPFNLWSPSEGFVVPEKISHNSREETLSRFGLEGELQEMVRIWVCLFPFIVW